MSARPDDDAFSWEGDDDPTLRVDAPAAEAGGAETDPAADADAGARTDASKHTDVADDPVALPEGFTAVGRGSDEVGRIEDDGTVVMPGERAPMGNAALIGLGVLGGVYLLFAVGWVIGGLRLQSVAGFLVSSDGDAPPLWTGGNIVALWLAVLAPPIWFATVLWLTRTARPWLRWVLLAVGAILLIPWPFIMVGAVGT